MSETAVKTPMREVRLRVASCFALIMMSCDSLNPVKIACEVLNIDTKWALIMFIVGFITIIYANSGELAYFSVKVFFHSIMSIFFSSMEVLGKQNIPEHGPVIFTGNHMNQFVDGAVMLITNPKKVSFLVAEKSHKTTVVGGFTRAIGSIPVSRPQDISKPGKGRIYFDGLKVFGEGTEFTKLVKGDKIRPGRSVDSYKIKTVISDTEGILADDYGESSPLNEHVCQGKEKWANYDILGYVDQSQMFAGVESALAAGGCLGIFPEGGSHDNTDLLPLKAGVAAIALGVYEKYGVTVPIVPVGLNYFRGHHFRGRVVVEFGQPIHIKKDLIQTYKDSKRAGYKALLSEVEEGMRSVIVTASNYDELKLIHTVRRLYQRSSTEMETKVKQDLARRFSLAYKIMKEKYNGTLPQDLLDLQKKLENYQESLENWGLRDYQLMTDSHEVSFSKTLYTFLHGLFILGLASIPSLVLNAPVGLAASYWSNNEAKKDLKASRVKLAARDVILSKKIVFSIVAVPVLWITYALLLICFSSLQYRTIAVLFLCCPFFSYLGVMAVESSLVDLKDLRPAFLRLLPSFQTQIAALPKQRLALQKEVRDMVRKYGPELGVLYYDKTSEWEKLIKKSPSHLASNLSAINLLASAHGGNSAATVSPSHKMAEVHNKDDGPLSMDRDSESEVPAQDLSAQDTLLPSSDSGDSGEFVDKEEALKKDE